TGALSFLMLEKGAVKVTCGDISEYMLSQCRKKATDKGYGEDKIDFRLLDAESLPFEDNSFDIVVTGMTLGLLPDQRQAIKEMARVVRPGGIVSVGAHGPEHYWEPADTYFRAINKRYVLGYRFEFWPRNEKEVHNMMAQAGLSDIRTRREIWRNRFASGGDAFDFFTAISSSWWYAKFPEEKRRADYQRVRDYFNKKNKNVVTDDIILAYGRKLSRGHTK
ncbi:MAG: methyltransferase domain-containing protein, partial [Dehalococcoidia bacterium]